MLAKLTPIPLDAPGNRSRWRHWKGSNCTVSAVGHHTETGELLVFYLEESSGVMFARPLASWHETVYGKPRFEALTATGK